MGVSYRENAWTTNLLEDMHKDYSIRVGEQVKNLRLVQIYVSVLFFEPNEAEYYFEFTDRFSLAFWETESFRGHARACKPRQRFARRRARNRNAARCRTCAGQDTIH